MASRFVLLSILFFIVPLHSYASQCDGFDNSFQRECVKLIFTSQSAPRNCNRFTNRNIQLKRLSCLRIAARAFDENSVRSCEGYSSIDVVTECLDTISGKEFDQNAFKACRDFGDWNVRKQCLNTIANHRFQEDAVAVCDKMRRIDQTVRCFAAIKNRSYRRLALNGCESARKFDDQISCLEDSRNLENDKVPGETHPTVQ